MQSPAALVYPVHVHIFLVESVNGDKQEVQVFLFVQTKQFFAQETQVLRELLQYCPVVQVKQSVFLKFNCAGEEQVHYPPDNRKFEVKQVVHTDAEVQTLHPLEHAVHFDPFKKKPSLQTLVYATY